MYPHQKERLDAALETFGVDALVATSAADVAYLTGFWSFSLGVYPTDIAAVYSKAGTALVIPTIDAPAFSAGGAAADHVACHGPFFVNVADHADEHARRAARLAAESTDSAAEALARVLEALGLRGTRVGLDAPTPPGALPIAARVTPSPPPPPAGGGAGARLVKGPYEIECLAHALRIAEEAIHSVLGELKPGTTEREAVELYERAVSARRGTPYAAMIAFGPSGALPAAPPGDRALRPG